MTPRPAGRGTTASRGSPALSPARCNASTGTRRSLPNGPTLRPSRPAPGCLQGDARDTLASQQIRKLSGRARVGFLPTDTPSQEPVDAVRLAAGEQVIGL